MRIPRDQPPRFGYICLVALLSLLFSGQSAFSRPIPGMWPPVQMKLADTNSPAWHSIIHRPDPNQPKFPFYDKFNPIWWAENADEPTPPAWYLPGEKHRNLKWHFRNPFHNLDFYVVGVADRKFTRSGHYPERNSDPHGGWDVEVIRRWTTFLPFISYERPKITFYFGWRESGAFGVELRLHHKMLPVAKPSPAKPK